MPTIVFQIWNHPVYLNILQDYHAFLLNEQEYRFFVIGNRDFAKFKSVNILYTFRHEIEFNYPFRNFPSIRAIISLIQITRAHIAEQRGVIKI